MLKPLLSPNLNSVEHFWEILYWCVRQRSLTTIIRTSLRNIFWKNGALFLRYSSRNVQNLRQSALKLHCWLIVTVGIRGNCANCPFQQTFSHNGNDFLHYKQHLQAFWFGQRHQMEKIFINCYFLSKLFRAEWEWEGTCASWGQSTAMEKPTPISFSAKLWRSCPNQP